MNMLRLDQPIPDCTDTLHELARVADNNGDALTARLFAHIAELRDQLGTLEETISDTVTLEKWEKEHGPAKDYYEFFHECFTHLDGYYPCPSITSDYDKSVIFDAIKKNDAQSKDSADAAYWSGYEDGKNAP